MGCTWLVQRAQVWTEWPVTSSLTSGSFISSWEKGEVTTQLRDFGECFCWMMANELLGWQNQCDSWLLGLNNEIGKCKRKNANVKENVKEISSSKVSSTTAALNEKNNGSCFRQCSLNEEDVFKHALRAMQMNLGLIWCLERRSLACF